MKRKFLDDVGVSERWWTWYKGKPTMKERQAIRTYGFGHKECFGLDQTFYLWLYERLMMYLNDASGVVDLEYHTFEFEGEKYTQRQLIDRMLDDLRFIFSEDYNDTDPEHYKREREIAQIWAVVLPAMWW